MKYKKIEKRLFLGFLKNLSFFQGHSLKQVFGGKNIFRYI